MLSLLDTHIEYIIMLVVAKITLVMYKYIFNFITDHTTVLFTRGACTDPYLYLSSEETEITVEQYEVYMTDGTERNPGFKVRI